MSSKCTNSIIFFPEVAGETFPLKIIHESLVKIKSKLVEPSLYGLKDGQILDEL